MYAADANQHNLVAGKHLADAVNHRDATQRPAITGGVDNLRQRLFGHAGIVLQRQRRNVIAEIMITHLAGEGHHGAIFIIGRQPVILLRHGKSSLLDPNPRLHISLRSPVGKTLPHRPSG